MHGSWGSRWKVYAEPWADRVSIYLIRDTPTGPETAAAISPGGEYEWVPFKAGAVPPAALLRLPSQLAQGLAEEFDGFHKASDAAVAALADAQKVRDRLLSLVEAVISERS